MFFYYLPEWVIGRIETLRGAFFWSSTYSVSSIKCLRCDNVCKSKDQECLEVKDIRDQNTALLGKWLWKALNEKDADWIKLLKARLYNRRKLERLDRKPIIDSSFWKGVWKCNDSFKCGITFNCGDDKC